MTKKYLSFVITHGSLACSIKEVAEQLIKPATELRCYSNSVQVLEEIEKDILGQIEREKPEKVAVFVDLVGGSCWIAANRIKQGREQIAVIGGVNVPMLVSYFINYERLEWPELLNKITADAQKGVVCR